MAAQSFSADDLLEHGVFLRRLVRALVRDDADADDVLQETWLAALQRPPRHHDNPRGWLATVGVRLARRQHRTRARIARRERSAARDEAQPSTGDVVATAAWHREVAAAVLRLGEPQRAAVVQRFYEGATLREIAARQGIAVATASDRVREGLQRLRRELDRRAHGDGPGWRYVLTPVAAAHPEAWPRATSVLTKGVAVGVTTKATWITTAVAAVSFAAGWGAHGLTLPDAPDPVATPPAEVWTPELVGRAPEPPPDATPAEGTRIDPDGDERAPLDAAAWLQRILGASVTATGPVYAELAGLPPEAGRDILVRIFPDIEPAEKRMQALQSWSGPPPHRHFLDLVHVAAGDEDVAVEQLALRFLPYFGLPDLAEDRGAYARWHEENGDRPIADVTHDALIAWYERLGALAGDALRRALAEDAPPLHIRLMAADRAGLDSASLLRSRGALDLAASWLESGRPEIAAHGARWIAILGADEAFLRDRILPLVTSPARHEATVMTWAYRALGREGETWAADALLRALVETPRRKDWGSIAGALAATGDRRAIPAMIATIIADDSHDATYGIGHFGLARLTGVTYRETHDGAWWRRWWTEERHRLGTDVARMVLPDLQPAALREGR